MTTITLTPELEEVVAEQARKRETTPQAVVLDTLREKFRSAAMPADEWASRDDWERRLRAAAVHAGVSLTDEQVSREVIYEDHD